MSNFLYCIKSLKLYKYVPSVYKHKRCISYRSADTANNSCILPLSLRTKLKKLYFIVPYQFSYFLVGFSGLFYSGKIKIIIFSNFYKQDKQFIFSHLTEKYKLGYGEHIAALESLMSVVLLDIAKIYLLI